ncbi:MAG: sulfatase [Phycicoccus sp.]
MKRSTERPAGTRPNIVVILVDDLGWADLTCYGSTFHETPHLDALAAGGVRFTDAYAAAPVCSPSRAALMSGKYPARVGVTNFIGGHAVGSLADVPYLAGLPQNEYSLARALGDDGYATWHVGKWHLGGPLTSPEVHGFDVNIGGGADGCPTSYVSPYDLPALPDGPDGEYLTTRLTDEAVRLVTEHDGERPFLLNLWHYTVHVPCQAPAPLVEKYRMKAARLGLPEHPVETGPELSAWHLAGRHVERRTAQSDPVYAAMVETLDDSVGAVVDALRTTGRLEDTVIVFSSDNGGLATAEGSPTCNAPLAEGKGWMQDGGVRVPLIVSAPGRVEPATSSVVTTTPDLYPTVLGLAAVPPRPGQAVDGVDIWPAVRGRAFDRGPVFWHYPHYSNQGGTPGAAVRDGRWKLIRWFEDDREALYDLEDDISESRDLAAAEPGIRHRLAALLDDWSADVGALLPRPNPYGRAGWPTG